MILLTILIVIVICIGMSMYAAHKERMKDENEL